MKISSYLFEQTNTETNTDNGYSGSLTGKPPLSSCTSVALLRVVLVHPSPTSLKHIDGSAGLRIAEERYAQLYLMLNVK